MWENTVAKNVILILARNMNKIRAKFNTNINITAIEILEYLIPRNTKTFKLPYPKVNDINEIKEPKDLSNSLDTFHFGWCKN